MKTMNCPQCDAMIELTGIISDVEEFHRKFGLEYGGDPRELPEDVEKFRVKTMQEELNEYTASNTLEDRLDALVDLMYFAIGTAHLHGFTTQKFTEAFHRVHRANMQKVRAQKPGDSKRGSTWDVVKPPGWVAPDLSDLVKGEQ